jgi:hypothetical protein
MTHGIDGGNSRSRDSEGTISSGVEQQTGFEREAVQHSEKLSDANTVEEVRTSRWFLLWDI